MSHCRRLPERFRDRSSRIPRSGRSGRANSCKNKRISRQRRRCNFHSGHPRERLSRYIRRASPSHADGWELYGQTSLAADFDDISFRKNTFGSIDLFKYLTAHKYFRIELCGLVSHICVLANAIIARTARPDTPVVIDATCTGAADRESL